MGDLRTKKVLTAEDLTAVLAKLNNDDAVDVPLMQTITEAIEPEEEHEVGRSNLTSTGQINEFVLG